MTFENFFLKYEKNFENWLETIGVLSFTNSQEKMFFGCPKVSNTKPMLAVLFRTS